MKEIKIIYLPTADKKRKEVTYIPPTNPQGRWWLRDDGYRRYYIHRWDVGQIVKEKLKEGKEGWYPVVIKVGSKTVFSNI